MPCAFKPASIAPSTSRKDSTFTVQTFLKPMKSATKRLAGSEKTSAGVPTCWMRPEREDDDPIREGEGLGLVVGDVDGRDLEPLVEGLELVAQLDAQLRVEVGERLVEQEEPRLEDDAARDGDALLLAAGHLGREFGGVALEVDEPQRGVDPLRHLGLADAAELEPEGDVLAHGEVREQRVVLEDHAELALFRRDFVDRIVDALVVDPDLARW